MHDSLAILAFNHCQRCGKTVARRTVDVGTEAYL
jgi:hypothetical protein